VDKDIHILNLWTWRLRIMFIPFGLLGVRFYNIGKIKTEKIMILTWRKNITGFCIFPSTILHDFSTTT